PGDRMTEGWPTALLSLAPATSVLASYPRSPGRAAVFFVVGAAGSEALWAGDPTPASGLEAAWTLVGCAVSWVLAWRSARDQAVRESDLAAVRARREALG